MSVAWAALVVAVAALVVATMALRGVRAAGRASAPVVVDEPFDDVDWQLQWIEPGVYFLANTSGTEPALQVEVSSSLTPVSGGSATSSTVHVQRVNPGAWVEVRHPAVGQRVLADLEALRRSTAVVEELRRRPALDVMETATLAAADEQVYELHDQVEYTLSYSVSWRTHGGAPRLKTPLDQRLVPSPSGV